MPAKIPATVVTGFLGAGKTTLIRHMLQNADGKRIALIINEFGDTLPPPIKCPHVIGGVGVWESYFGKSYFDFYS